MAIRSALETLVLGMPIIWVISNRLRLGRLAM
jgi:hypothetical protein